MDLDEYLISKKINPVIFKQECYEQWKEFDYLLQLMHPKSFTMQKLYIINGLRRRFPLK